MPQADLAHLLEHRAELDLRERRRPVLRHQLADVLLERRQIEVAPVDRAGEHQRHVGKEPDVLLPERHQDQHQVLAEVRPHFAHHPEVQEIDGVLPPHQVPGVRVRMEEPVDEDLLVVGLEELARRLLP